MGSVLHRRIVFDFHCNNKHISAEIQSGGVCRLSTASSERISHAEVERRVLPLEIVDPPLARGVVGIVQLNTPVQAQHGELDVETHQARLSAPTIDSFTPLESLPQPVAALELIIVR